MMRALYSSVAGLKTHQTKMDVIGNNISNVNTVGFKSSRVTFSTMMYQTTSSASGPNVDMGTGGINAKQIGLGANFASTAIDIEGAGASESTGKAFDLKISDKSTTSFYIVNTGTENVFTRAGAFYVDGAGNLCMESTGYTVMGWQVDANGNIRKDTVSPLKIMSAGNQTSQPEYTTRAQCSGLLDDNSSNVNSDTGYNMNLNFFDNLGYAYTGKFAVQKTGGKGEYTVNLVDILDSNGKSILSGQDIKLGDLFGSGSQGSHVDVTDNYTMASGMANALKKLAMDTTNTGGIWTYNFPAEVINEYLGSTSAYSLPSGLTVQYQVIDPNTTATPAPTAPLATPLKVLDSSGADVTKTYVDQFAALATAAGSATPWLSETNISKEVTVTGMVQEWYDKNLLDTATNPADGKPVYLLKKTQLETLQSTFKTKTDGTTSADFTNLDTSSKVQVTVDPATGNITFSDFDNNSAAAATLLGGTTDTSRLFTLNDYLEQGYLEVSADAINDMKIFTTDLPKDLELRYKTGDGAFTIVTPSADGFKMQFSTADGTLTYIGSEGSTSQTLKMSMYPLEDNPFTDIQIDFSTLKNLANGGTSTAALSGGDGDGSGRGKKVGTMTGLNADSSGKIYGTYSNGDTVLLGQIAVARFANASGLESIGNNCFKTTMNSGEFDGIGEEINSDGSSIETGVLEMSNVDLATEFTQMITTQRGYQANSRVISTSDSILEELVNLKR